MQLRMGLDSRLSSFDLRQKAVEGCETIINQATLLTWTESSVSYSCPPGIDCPGQLDAFHLAKSFLLQNFGSFLHLDPASETTQLPCRDKYIITSI